MRYLVLTDIHANLEALEACLADARERQYDETLVLGDVVGYGADPNAVIQAIQALNPLAIIRVRSGIMSGLRLSQPAMQVLTSALMTPTVRNGEPILKLTVCRG